MRNILYLYIDNARELVDYAVDPPAGAIGSNWQVAGEFESADQAHQAGQDWLGSMLSDGFTRGHWTSPTF